MHKIFSVSKRSFDLLGNLLRDLHHFLQNTAKNFAPNIVLIYDLQELPKNRVLAGLLNILSIQELGPFEGLSIVSLYNQKKKKILLSWIVDFLHHD